MEHQICEYFDIEEKCKVSLHSEYQYLLIAKEFDGYILPDMDNMIKFGDEVICEFFEDKESGESFVSDWIAEHGSKAKLELKHFDDIVKELGDEETYSFFWQFNGFSNHYCYTGVKEYRKKGE